MCIVCKSTTKEENMSALTRKTFSRFWGSQIAQVKQLLTEDSGAEEVKEVLIDYLVLWNDLNWIDWENIGFVIEDLGKIGFWNIVPYTDFLKEASSRVSKEIIDTLKKNPIELYNSYMKGLN